MNPGAIHPTPQSIAPGAVVILPDGRKSVIVEAMPNGDFMTDLGLTLSPQGILRSGEAAGQSVRLDPEFSANQSIQINIPEGRAGTGTAVIPDNAAQKAPEKEPVILQPEVQKAENQQPGQQQAPGSAVVPEKTVTPVKPVQEPSTREPAGPLTIAEMLPMTVINPAQEKTGAKEPEKKEPEKKVTPEKKPEKAAPKAAPEKKSAPKAEKKAQPEKARTSPGQPLKIPEEAIKSGSLAFLEGCWQGTRPEYYSKRTIKECFCFGPNGKNGKRRIFDGPRRMCIGGTNAKFSGNGILSVTSSGAACNDGERWGSAEMVCRNSGPHTPCSWIFKDANNGRQAYEIPFVRVESCGR